MWMDGWMDVSEPYQCNMPYTQGARCVLFWFVFISFVLVHYYFPPVSGVGWSGIPGSRSMHHDLMPLNDEKLFCI